MDSLDGPDELRQGTPKNYLTVWKKGDPVPAASEEMERYIELEEKIFGGDDDGDDSFLSDVETLDRLRETVPEWN